MVVWAAGRGHTIQPDTWGASSPGVDLCLPEEDLRSVMGTPDIQRET